MTDTRTHTELAEAILAAIDEAREHGVPDERIVEMLADIVKGLRDCADGTARSPSRRAGAPYRAV